jgi:hypothetical protein
MSSLAGKNVVVIGAVRSESGHAGAFRVAEWLGLAAAPTFAIMALLTAQSGGEQDVFCAALQHSSPLGGMVPMYLLMSAFHSAPWLKLISSRRMGSAHPVLGVRAGCSGGSTNKGAAPAFDRHQRPEE